jgi:hypothetical protein
MGPQSWKIHNFGNFEIPIWESRDKMSFGCAHVERCRVYYKGKVVASPKFGPWWVLWIQFCMCLVLAPKVPSLLFGLCRSMWVIERFSFFLIPSRSSTTPLYPKMLQMREHARTLCSFVIFISDLQLSLSRNLGVHKKVWS